MVRYQLQPCDGAAGKILGINKIDSDLCHQGREHETDQTHIMIKREPTCTSVVLYDFKSIFGDAMTIRRY